MINNWFECKVKYVKINENGKERKVTEPYLVDAVSFTEAEARIHTELEKMIHSDFIVTNISKSNISELFPNSEGDRWFKAKTTFVTVDDESGKSKKSHNYMLVQANNAKEAYDHLFDGLSDMIVPFEIPSVTESPIMDVFPFFKDVVNEEVPANLKPMKEVLSESLIEQAANLVVVNQSAATSMLQRNLNLNYEDANILMDELEAKEIVGPFLGSKPREVLILSIPELIAADIF